MLISPSEKTVTSSNEEPNRAECETEISIDFSRIPVETPNKTNKDITIQLTSIDNHHSILNNIEEPTNYAALSSRDKLIRLKIKMPKSPKGNSEIKRERSFYTEKDFLTLPKELIKFANSMMGGDDPRREAKKRYCDKSLNAERSANYDIEKQFGAISPIAHESSVTIPSSTPKDTEEVAIEFPPERTKIEPLYFTKMDRAISILKEPTTKFNEVRICKVIEKKEQNIKPNENIIAKLKPYSKYHMQYSHYLRKLQNKDCKYFKQDFCLPSSEENASNVTNIYSHNDLDENEVLALVNQSTKYNPLMGKTALLAKMVKKHERDSEIVKELVIDKFSPFFERRRRERRDNINNYSLPIDNIDCDKEEKIQKNNNILNQSIHRIVVNEQTYAVINKNNKLNDHDLKPVEEDDIKTNSKMGSNSSHQEVDLQKPSDFSAYSDYDVEKFLQNAVGDTSLLSQTMDISPRSKRLDHPSADHSIATGEMSLLVSKASSISTFCSTVWRRITRRNSAIAPQESNIAIEDEEELRKEERNKRITLLKQETSVQNEIIRQASKALDYCDNLPGVDFVSQRVEAERVILIATHKNKMIQHEIEDVTYYSTIRSCCSYLGSFSIRNLQFKVKDVYKKEDEHSQWFVCVINRGTETVASVAVKASDDGSVIFKEEFSFDFLSPDFEVDISIFTLKVKKHKDPRSTFQRMKFFSFRRDSKPAVGRKTLTSRFSRTSLRSPNKEYALPIPIRKTSFLLLGETRVTIKDVQKTTLILTQIVNFANIFESFTASMTSNVNIEESFSDFLNIGTESGGKMMWHRRWCSLQDTKFKYWNSPNDEETDTPLKTIDLMYSIKDVGLADRSICPRARTLQLEILIPLISEEDSRYTIERYFLTSDTTESMHNWEKTLNSIISTLRVWNCLKSDSR